MKKIFASFFFIFSFSSFAMAQGTVQASIGIGSAANRIKIYIKSDITLKSNISTLEFNIAIPETETVAKPTVTSSASSISWQIDDPITEGGYKNYAITTGTSPILTFNLTAGSEFEVMELEFSDQTVLPNSVSLITLPLGGVTTNGFALFYCTGSPSSDGSNLYYARTTDATYRTDIVNGFSYNADGTQGTDISSATLTATPTPVKLSSFSVDIKDNTAALSWSVENQDANSSHFEIERSANGKDFNQVAMVNATNNTKQSYSFNDNDPSLSGSVYYRLKMVDKNGQFAYSDIKTVQFANTGFSVLVYPNPIESVSKLRVNLEKPQVIKVSISNSTGNLVQHFEIDGQRGMNEKSINLSTVPAGSYMIRIQSGQKNKVISVIKK
ncbi:T9SS C-terminal target domain-containing protein [Hanamia caeni]|jgi:hypothetical protein|uniref:T9SS C-terminal target domain-containing protein n=1 Tax=Hanamia caeni TaxID=2294116 RepID=A0A3M9NFN1_9BACT|nr:T9SS type A sorting domain-containing protein [Hanamia caeni]RNI36586.1 T9SS C-terminal target domain-containing protein [Hanamia caeni]